MRLQPNASFPKLWYAGRWGEMSARDSLSAQPRSKLGILIADDAAEVRRDLRTVLQLMPDLEVIGEAVDGIEAVSLAEKLRPDIVLMDLRMPGLDGFQICRTIKADPETSSTVVIAMTGFYSPETEARILECGAIRCFAKPVEASTLSAFIDSVFEQQKTKSGRSRRRPARA